MHVKKLEKWVKSASGLPWWAWLGNAGWIVAQYNIGMWVLSIIGYPYALFVAVANIWWLYSLLAFIDRLMRAIVSYIYKHEKFSSVDINVVLD